MARTPLHAFQYNAMSWADTQRERERLEEKQEQWATLLERAAHANLLRLNGYRRSGQWPTLIEVEDDTKLTGRCLFSVTNSIDVHDDFKVWFTFSELYHARDGS